MGKVYKLSGPSEKMHDTDMNFTQTCRSTVILGQDVEHWFKVFFYWKGTLIIRVISSKIEAKESTCMFQTSDVGHTNGLL